MWNIACPDRSQINYSRFLDRWFISTLNSATTELIIIWSDSGVITPETVYTRATFASAELAPENSPPARLDNLMLSTDVNAVYITVDAIQISNGTFLGSSTLVIANSSISTGNTWPAFTVFSGVFSGPIMQRFLVE